MTAARDQVAELLLLAGRAEASIDESLTVVGYMGVRKVAISKEEAFGPPFNMFAVSVASPNRGGAEKPYRGVKDIMFCRTPEVANFIVALINFGGAIVAERSDGDAHPAIEKELRLTEQIVGIDPSEPVPGRTPA